MGLCCYVGNNTIKRGRQHPTTQLMLGSSKLGLGCSKLTLRESITRFHIGMMPDSGWYRSLLVGIVALGDDHILHLQTGLFNLELCLLDGTLLLSNGIAKLEQVELCKHLPATDLLTVLNQDLCNRQSRLKRQVGITFGHNLAHGGRRRHSPNLFLRRRSRGGLLLFFGRRLLLWSLGLLAGTACQHHHSYYDQ